MMICDDDADDGSSASGIADQKPEEQSDRLTDILDEEEVREIESRVVAMVLSCVCLLQQMHMKPLRELYIICFMCGMVSANVN